MHSVFTTVASLHQTIGFLEWTARRKLASLDKALNRDDGPHPDDVPELRSMMMSDALALRKLAAEIDVRRAELERDAVPYLEAAE